MPTSRQAPCAGSPQPIAWRWRRRRAFGLNLDLDASSPSSRMPHLFEWPHERVAPAAATNTRGKPHQTAQSHAEDSHDDDKPQDVIHAIEATSQLPSIMRRMLMIAVAQPRSRGGRPGSSLVVLGGRVYPALTYRDVRAALIWLAEAFGFEVHLLGEEAAMVTNRGAVALIQRDRPEDLHGTHIGMAWVYVVVDDADAHYARAKAAGADLQGPAHDYGEGYRGYSVRDLEGNLWTFGTGPVAVPGVQT
jgi:uncharacterized glyoxalase superfamily protein PhnB